MAPILIADAGDPRVAAYTSIRERDLTGRGDRFIVEGKVTLEVLARRSRFEVDSVFIAEHRLDAVEDTLALLPAETPIYSAPADIFDEIAGFPVHRGVLACARKGEALQIEVLAASPRLVVGIGLSNHDNVGALFRNAAAFGADGILLDSECCDPLYRKAIRVSAGAALWLPFVHGTDAGEILAGLKAAGTEVWALTPRQPAVDLNRSDIPNQLALMVGAEGPGLPEALINAATPVTIPMTDGFDSINVATAAAIALAHVFAADKR
ncbi:MAG: RNA methyltransferase [Pseudomonadota bacterium]